MESFSEPVNSTMENITEDEAALYDRQIRLWGLDAQRRFASFKLKKVFNQTKLDDAAMY